MDIVAILEKIYNEQKQLKGKLIPYYSVKENGKLYYIYKNIFYRGNKKRYTLVKIEKVTMEKDYPG